MGEESEVVVALSTLPSAEVAATLARTLVEERLAACVNIVPGVRSIYRWQERVCDVAEVLCIIKTTRAEVVKLRERLAVLHPYDVPELVVMGANDGLPDYLAWVRAQVG